MFFLRCSWFCVFVLFVSPGARARGRQSLASCRAMPMRPGLPQNSSSCLYFTSTALGFVFLFFLCRRRARACGRAGARPGARARGGQSLASCRDHVDVLKAIRPRQRSWKRASTLILEARTMATILTMTTRGLTLSADQVVEKMCESLTPELTPHLERLTRTCRSRRIFGKLR